MTDPVMVPTLINGHWALLLPEHRAARPHWSRPEGWERARLDSMHSILEPGQTIVDVGSEEGDLTALYALWGCNVVPMEPNPRVWPNIRAIFEANNLRDRILSTWVGFAGDETITLGHEPTAPPYIYPSCAFGPVIGDHGFCNLLERPDMPRIRLDDLSEETGITFDAITIDCEGSELSVLRGAMRVLLTQRPAVWASVHPAFMDEMYGHTPEELLEYMEGVGYMSELLAVDHEHHYLFLPV